MTQWNWHNHARHTAGKGRVEPGETGVRLVCPVSKGGVYCNAQLDDHADLPRRKFALTPPVRLHLLARFSHPADELRGTAGFGFWNDPFLMTRGRIPALPQACWFFLASAPSDMPLALDVPGLGFKAATLDAGSKAALCLAPLAPIVTLLNQFNQFYQRIWPWVAKRLSIRERTIDIDIQQWHTYEIVWSLRSCVFIIDGQVVMSTKYSPRGPLGTVIWIDNQYMVATPRGRFRHGLVSNLDQWLEIAVVHLDHL